MNTIKIALVDDHQIVLDGLSALLKDVDNIQIVFTTTQPNSIETFLNNRKVDILITDIMMPDMSGIELARKIKKDFPEIKIMALSMNCDWQTVNELINKVEIAGYALKNIDKEELINAIVKIASENGFYFSNEVLDELDKLKHIKTQNANTQLTQREIEIIRLIEKEMGNKQIAAELFISERTVETHRKNIFRKTKTNSILGIVKYAYEQRLIIK